MSIKSEIITFGCRLNTYESEVIRNHTEQANLSNSIIVNTCAVTLEAERQARQAIRRAKKNRPDAEIIVTGCAAQINPQKWSLMPEVTRVVGNKEKLELNTFLEDRPHPSISVNNIMEIREQAGHLVAGFEGRTRAYVQIQQGCNHRCTFCIIPFGRGNSRSVPLGDIVSEAKKLVGAGYKELILAGVDLTSYGADLPGSPNLGQSVSRLVAMVPELPRLRLSSVDPSEIDTDLVRLIAEEPRLMPHLHLSVQAGDDLVLKRMKRRHSSSDVIALTEKLRKLRPEIVFGADLIAGFPTETEEMFQNTVNLIDQAGLTWLHVFPFSSRPGTPAEKMPQMPMETRKKRAALLRRQGDQAVARILESYVGTKASVLIEKNGTGRSESFARVSVNSSPENGELVNTLITHTDGVELYGSVF